MAAANEPSGQATHLALASSGAWPALHVSQPPEREAAGATPFGSHATHALASFVRQASQYDEVAEGSRLGRLVRQRWAE